MSDRNLVSLVLPVLLSAALLALGPRTAAAVVVAPGATAPLSGTSFAANPDLGGVVLADTLRPFVIRDRLGNVLIRGNLQDRVVRSTNTGKLIFGPRLRDLEAPSGVAWVMRFQVTGYDGIRTDVEYRVDGLGNVGPNDVTRSAGGGDRLDFRHDPNLIAPPDQGRFLSIATDAEHFAPVGTATIMAQNDFGSDVFAITLRFTNAPDPDSDGDGISDSRDVCPAVPDARQLDSDGNGIGDVCECGDQNRDGTVNVLDLVAINAAVFNPALATPLCDTNEDGRCNVSDIVGANAKIFGGRAYCAAYPSPR